MNLLVSKLSSENISKYLTLNGWKFLCTLNENRVQQFLSPSEDDAVLLPIDNSFSDYENSMIRALMVIADEEKITVKRLFNKLVYPSSDVLRWRIADDSTSNGVISFGSMGANIEYIKDLLGTACLDILNPSVYHAKIYTKEVMEQINQYSFGQTEVGSYILNVLCPLGFYQYQVFNPEEEKLPLSRRINLKMLRNINNIQISVEEGSQEMRDNVEKGVISVNFLNSLSEMYEENKDSEITISADWSSDIPLIGESDPVSKVLLKPRCHDAIMKTIEDYSPKKEQNIPSSYYGKITNIGAEANVGDRIVFDIKVATIGENLRTITVNATLNYSQYFDLADKAFQAGLDIRVSGIMSKTARSIKLSDANIVLAQ